MSMNLSNIALLNINGANYCCIISRIRRREAIEVMQNIDLIEKVKHYYNLLSQTKLVKEILSLGDT